MFVFMLRSCACVCVLWLWQLQCCLTRKAWWQRLVSNGNAAFVCSCFSIRCQWIGQNLAIWNWSFEEEGQYQFDIFRQAGSYVLNPDEVSVLIDYQSELMVREQGKCLNMKYLSHLSRDVLSCPNHSFSWTENADEGGVLTLISNISLLQRRRSVPIVDQTLSISFIVASCICPGIKFNIRKGSHLCRESPWSGFSCSNLLQYLISFGKDGNDAGSTPSNPPS